MKMLMKIYIRVTLMIITIFYSNLYGQFQYSDMNAMFNDITPFEDEIELDFLNVTYTNNQVSSIYWFDQDSIRFSKLFHYDDQNNLFLISEFRDQVILKEVYFASYNVADRFIRFLFGDKFYTHENYITEIIYNKSKLPVFYGIKSTTDDYIGHIRLNYDENNYLIREVWFQGKRKIREFLK